MKKTLVLIGKLLLAACIVLAVVFLALALYIYLHFGGTVNPEEGSQSFGKEPCGLVFGAAVHRNSLPGPGIERRVATAAKLYKEGILRHIILSGGKGSQDVESEAAVMRDVAIADGISANDIVMEDQSRSTWENLVNSRPLTGSCTTVIGISDRYHLARIEYLASLQGFRGLQTVPADMDVPWTFEIKSFSREVAALLYYLMLSPMLSQLQK
jgi:uncharacterized SAM-binding protein YcdF (DUF218 family)